MRFWSCWILSSKVCNWALSLPAFVGVDGSETLTAAGPELPLPVEEPERTAFFFLRSSMIRSFSVSKSNDFSLCFFALPTLCHCARWIWAPHLAVVAYFVPSKLTHLDCSGYLSLRDRRFCSWSCASQSECRRAAAAAAAHCWAARLFQNLNFITTNEINFPNHEFHYHASLGVISVHSLLQFFIEFSGKETRTSETFWLDKVSEVRVSITQKVLELWNFTVKNENIGHMSTKSGNGNEISSTESTGVTILSRVNAGPIFELRWKSQLKNSELRYSKRGSWHQLIFTIFQCFFNFFCDFDGLAKLHPSTMKFGQTIGFAKPSWSLSKKN